MSFAPGFTVGPVGITSHGVSDVKPSQITLPSSPVTVSGPAPESTADGAAPRDDPAVGATVGGAVGDPAGGAVGCAVGAALVAVAVVGLAVGDAVGAPVVQAAATTTTASKTSLVTIYLPLPIMTAGLAGSPGA